MKKKFKFSLELDECFNLKKMHVKYNNSGSGIEAKLISDLEKQCAKQGFETLITTLKDYCEEKGHKERVMYSDLAILLRQMGNSFIKVETTNEGTGESERK